MPVKGEEMDSIFFFFFFGLAIFLVPKVRIVLPEYTRLTTGLPWQTENHVSLQSMCACMLSCFSRVRLCDPWTVALQAPLSMGVFRQEYWSGLPFPPPGDLPDPGIELTSPTLQADS